MYVTHEITVDLLRPEPNVIHVVQDDSTRKILLTLLSGGMPYSIGSDLGQEDYTGVVSFLKADGKGGTYDTANMEFTVAEPASGDNPASDGLYERTAYTYVLTKDTTVVPGKTYYEGTGEDAVSAVSGTVNKFEVYLDGQCFTFPGWTRINVRFYTESGKLLHTFAIDADVQASAQSATVSTDYNNLESIADIRQALRFCLRYDQMNLTDNEKTQARTNIDAYKKPGDGVPASDMATEVQQSLAKADSSLQNDAIDATLSVSGKVADAKAAGDAIGEKFKLPANGTSGQVLISDGVGGASWGSSGGGGGINELFLPMPPKYNEIEFIGDFVVGGLQQGNISTNTHRIASKTIISYNVDTFWASDYGWRYAIHTFDNNDVFVADSGWLPTSYPSYMFYTIPANTRFKVQIGRLGDSGTADLTEFKKHVYQLMPATDSDAVSLRKVLTALFGKAAYTSPDMAGQYAALNQLIGYGNIDVLPEGFTRYDYAQETTVNTNTITPRFPIEDIENILDYEIVAEFKSTLTSGQTNVFGVYGYGTSGNSDFSLFLQPSKIAIHYCGIDSGWNDFAGGFSSKTKIVVKDGFAIINDTIYIQHSGGMSQDFSSGQNKSLRGKIPVGVMGRVNGNANDITYTKQGSKAVLLYSFAVKTKEGEPLVNLIPCTNANSEPGLYDSISKQFYGVSNVWNDE